MIKRFSFVVLVVLIGLAVPVAVHAGEVGKPVAITPDQLKWVDNADAPGVKTAVTWGDPTKGAHGAFHKFPAGFTAPLHTHTANTHIVVIVGTMSLTGEDGKEMKLPVGSFFTQPSTFKHVTKCVGATECIIYVEADAKWDLKPVAAK